MEKGGGGGGGSQGYTKPISAKSPKQDNLEEDCSNVNIDTTLTNPILANLEGIEEGSVLQLHFPERLKRIEVIGLNHNICGYVTSSVNKLFDCYDKGFKFEVVLMSRNGDASFDILVRNKR